MIIDARFNDLDIISEHFWSAEVVIWDQGLSVTPNAASIAGGGGSLEALSELLLDFTFIDLSWMAELLGEEWDIVGWSCWVGRLDWINNWSGWVNNWSISPFACTLEILVVASILGGNWLADV